jgi:hypothetical protein
VKTALVAAYSFESRRLWFPMVTVVVVTVVIMVGIGFAEA